MTIDTFRISIQYITVIILTRTHAVNDNRDEGMKLLPNIFYPRLLEEDKG